MSNRSFWLGLGMGLVLTSVLLGLMMEEPHLSDEQLQDLARQRDYHLVPSVEWQNLKKNQVHDQEKRTERTSEIIYIYIPEGFSWEQTADVMVQAEIIADADEMMQTMTDMERQYHLQSGLYTFQSDEEVRDIVKKLSDPH